MVATVTVAVAVAEVVALADETVKVVSEVVLSVAAVVG